MKGYINGVIVDLGKDNTPTISKPKEVKQITFEIEGTKVTYKEAGIRKLLESEKEAVEEIAKIKESSQRNLSDTERVSLRENLDLLLDKLIEKDPKTATVEFRKIQNVIADIKGFDEKIKAVVETTNGLVA